MQDIIYEYYKLVIYIEGNFGGADLGLRTLFGRVEVIAVKGDIKCSAEDVSADFFGQAFCQPLCDDFAPAADAYHCDFNTLWDISDNTACQLVEDCVDLFGVQQYLHL